MRPSPHKSHNNIQSWLMTLSFQPYLILIGFALIPGPITSSHRVQATWLIGYAKFQLEPHTQYVHPISNNTNRTKDKKENQIYNPQGTMLWFHLTREKKSTLIKRKGSYPNITLLRWVTLSNTPIQVEPIEPWCSQSTRTCVITTSMRSAIQ